MFREITGNAERTLKWIEDYGIVLEEDGYERPFQSLSGGEQMAAALSVRLALLKQVSDIRLAFFDEPTTGLDPIMSNVINDLIIKIREELGATTVTITHDMQSARKIGKEIAFLFEGKIVWSGKMSEIDSTDNDNLRQFITGEISKSAFVGA